MAYRGVIHNVICLAAVVAVVRSIDVHNISANFLSRKSVRVTCILHSYDVIIKPELQLEIFDNTSATCGSGNTLNVNLEEPYDKIEHIAWGVNSTRPLLICVRVKDGDAWHPWRMLKIGPGARQPPLLVDLPPRQGSTSTYMADTTSTGVPEPSWHWLVNNTRFNTTHLPMPYDHGHKWGIKSPKETHGHLEIDVKYLTGDLHVNYEAQNIYGKIRSELVIVKHPYMLPRYCDESITNVIVNTAVGAVLECGRYDSFPQTQNSWYYANTSCDKCEHNICAQTRVFLTSYRNTVQNGEKLVFTRPKRADSGCYVCATNNAVKERERTCYKRVELSVTADDGDRIRTDRIQVIHKLISANDTSGFIQIDDSSVNAVVGGHLHLECSIQIYPYSSVEWFHNTSIAVTSSARHLISDGGVFLDIKDVTHSDEGSYDCKVKFASQYTGEVGKFQVFVEGRLKILQLESKSDFVGSNITLFCDVTNSRSILWFKNVDAEITGSEKYVLTDNSRKLTITSANHADTATYTCLARSRHDFQDTASATVVVLDSLIIHRIDAHQAADGSTSYSVMCDVSTDPNLDLAIVWALIGCPDNATLREIRPDKVTVTSETAIGRTCHVTCTAKSRNLTAYNSINLFRLSDVIEYDDINLDVSITVFPTTTDTIVTLNSEISGTLRDMNSIQETSWLSENKFGLLFMVVCGALIITLSVLFIKKFLTKRSAGRILSDDNDYGLTVTFRNNTRENCRIAENPIYMPCQDNEEDISSKLKKAEIKRDLLHVKEMIGKGQFGRVYEGSLDVDLKTHPNGQLEVAIKTLKYRADEQEMVDMFLREALMMKGFDDPNVLSLIGITFDHDRSPMVVLPYMEYGDLRTYISRPEMTLRVRELLLMGIQVASGMSYLSRRQFVHRDLAARNCMVNREGVVKVADFGLSRDIYQQEYYRTESNSNPLPIRWMAPESLVSRVFSTKTDVWSFGVLLWELMTRGATPYPCMENWAISTFIQQGGRMKQPMYCPSNVYKLMVRCWSDTPTCRPLFDDLKRALVGITSEESDASSHSSCRRDMLNVDIKCTRITECRDSSSSSDKFT